MLSRICAGWLVVCFAVPLWAQGVEPDAAQMIEQLSRPRTRSLRNLVVEDASGAVQPPSLSLLIHFEFNSTKVRAESTQDLEHLAQALLSPGLALAKFGVEGHTDAKGDAAYNLQLSLQRALAVRDVLVAHGVEGGRLVPSGKGSSALADPSQPFAAENRRVRIVNLDP
jgi:outer membrane protein OmpA-like peptidoglycan-associated protein